MERFDDLCMKQLEFRSFITFPNEEIVIGRGRSKIRKLNNHGCNLKQWKWKVINKSYI